jgi:hypothetical protein
MGVENLLPVHLAGKDGDTARVAAGRLEATVARDGAAGDTASSLLAVRAHAVRLVDAPEPGAVAARITFATNRGASALYEVTTDDSQILQASEDRRGGALRPVGARVGVRLRQESCCLVKA